jgi:hypothetical protein
MTTNTNSRAHAAYEGRIYPGECRIYAVYRGRRADEHIATFLTYDDMLREWERITDLCGMVDVHSKY